MNCVQETLFLLSLSFSLTEPRTLDLDTPKSSVLGSVSAYVASAVSNRQRPLWLLEQLPNKQTNRQRDKQTRDQATGNLQNPKIVSSPEIKKAVEQVW